ncbi:hypothetical protein BGW41_007605 [Actinomortierella wolfii]|nr:hypothetical protein BGW41_007605 [Actinomortierella wolfii]
MKFSTVLTLATALCVVALSTAAPVESLESPTFSIVERDESSEVIDFPDNFRPLPIQLAAEVQGDRKPAPPKGDKKPPAKKPKPGKKPPTKKPKPGKKPPAKKPKPGKKPPAKKPKPGKKPPVKPKPGKGGKKPEKPQKPEKPHKP